ncbi:MAG TPA: FtsX-like permease family protein, partial [Thermoplasmata archaeon]|nr:FtsX-like permease family protein [Thermoplasmata archaeon]
MAVGGIVGGLLLLLGAIAVLFVILGFRHPLAFRIGRRNVVRAPRRTALLLAGLLVATTIISGSLVVGDTIDTLAVHYTVLGAGHDDEAIENQTPDGALGFYNYSVYGSLVAATSGNPQIAGMAPEIITTAAVYDMRSATPQPNLYLIGGNANQSGQLGSFVSDDGATVDGPAAGQVILDDLAASELNASAGDPVVVYGVNGHPLALTVQAVVQDNIRGAFPTGGLGNSGSAFVDLPAAQLLNNVSSEINYIAVSNTGSQADRLANADGVNATLTAAIATIPAAHGLSVQEVFKTALTQEEMAGSGLTTLFLVLGLFSIAAGALLIVGIFLLLAEERKGEMGVLRAVGLRGRELVYAFLFEGVFYSAGSALAGTFLGVGVGYGLTYAFGALISEPGLSPAALLQSFTILPQTLVIAYTVGFLLTLGTVWIASRRASRLNIVRAIRDLPEPEPPVRTYTLAAILGALSILGGAALYAATYQGTTSLPEPVIGGTMVIAGFGLVAARFVKNRLAFSAMGVALLVWAGDVGLRLALLGPDHTGGIYSVFVEGIVLVAGAVILFAFNSATVAAALVRVIGGRSERAPVAKVGLSYPGRRPGRATISLAIFALVTFTLVAIAGVGSSLDASLGSLVQDESGGYQLVAYSGTSTPQLATIIA